MQSCDSGAWSDLWLPLAFKKGKGGFEVLGLLLWRDFPFRHCAMRVFVKCLCRRKLIRDSVSIRVFVVGLGISERSNKALVVTGRSSSARETPPAARGADHRWLSAL